MLILVNNIYIYYNNHFSMTHKYINLPVNPYKGCWYLCEGVKVLRELPPHFFHHWKEVQKYTLASFNTIVISGERTHLAVATGYNSFY